MVRTAFRFEILTRNKMIRSDDEFLSLIDSFQTAAIDGNWYPALEALAAATGSRSGELIVVGRDASVPLNLMTNVPEELGRRFIECKGGDPAVNPRVKAGLGSPLLRVMAEADFITPDEYDRNAHYREFAVPFDIPFICLATLDRSPNLLVGLAVLRSAQQGHISSEQRACFAAIASHVRAAVRTQAHLAGNAAALLTGTMEALSIPAFLCDDSGMVRQLTPAAEALVNGGSGLELRQGRLHAKQDADSQSLSSAIRAAAAGWLGMSVPALRTVVIRGAKPEDPTIVLDIVSLPSRGIDLMPALRVLIVSRSQRGSEQRKAAVMQSVYGLTAAETDIALQLARGRTAAAIATVRRVALSTVRLQIKTLLAKVGVNRQVELVARLNEL